MTHLIAGMRLIEALNWTDRVQIKTHRKRRINKKWAKRYGFKITPKRDFAWIGDCLIGHPAVIRDLIQIMEEAEKQR